MTEKKKRTMTEKNKKWMQMKKKSRDVSASSPDCET